MELLQPLCMDIYERKFPRYVVWKINIAGDKLFSQYNLLVGRLKYLKSAGQSEIFFVGGAVIGSATNDCISDYYQSTLVNTLMSQISITNIPFFCVPFGLYGENSCLLGDFLPLGQGLVYALSCA